VGRVALGGTAVPVETFVNEFWTSRQRAAHSLHEVSYRACFKPQLPRFFIERLSEPGSVVYDPFLGRGTTLLEAALLGRFPLGCDINPLSAVLLTPRLAPPMLEDVARRLERIDFGCDAGCRDDLLVFYHRDTLREICSLRQYLLDRERLGGMDPLDRWIRMVAVNRLTGHSPGFFSVYTLPPNQALSIASQKKINDERAQIPPRRSVPSLILSKTRSLLKDCHPDTRLRLSVSAERAQVITGPANATPRIPSSSVDLIVTSPPFLDVVDYAADNWLRCWFCGIDPDKVRLTIARRLEDWQAAMTGVLLELARVLKADGCLAFEVGEVRGGAIRLEEAVIPCGLAAGLAAELVLINSQKFTKTANVWGVTNNTKGTNSNRVVLFRKMREPAQRRRD
jgi:DNA modification methylase